MTERADGPGPEPGGDEELLLDLRKVLAEDPGAVGPFPSWTVLYVTVLVYAMVTVGVLYVFTAALDFSPS
jgi:hypothetical protein